jgi:hypothetical protein
VGRSKTQNKALKHSATHDFLFLVAISVSVRLALAVLVLISAGLHIALFVVRSSPSSSALGPLLFGRGVAGRLALESGHLAGDGICD